MYIYSLVCRETGQRICIGQGAGKLDKIFSSEPDVMARLCHFLTATYGKTLLLQCDVPSSEHYSYDEFEMDGGLLVTPN